MKAYQERLRAMERRVGRLVEEGQSRGWLEDAWRSARDTFRETGFPRAKDEGWRFTPLARTLDIDFEPATDHDVDWASLAARADALLGTTSAPRVYLAGGAVRCVPSAIMGAVRLSAVDGGVSGEAGVPLLGGAAHGGRDGFATMNEVLARRGAAIRVESGGSSEGAHVEVVVAAPPYSSATFEVPRYWLELAPSARASVLEVHLAPAGDAPVLQSVLAQVRLGASSDLEHIRVVEGAPNAHRVERLEVEQLQESRYAARFVTLGSPLSRLDMRLVFAGEGAQCEMQGLYVAERGEVVDKHIFVDHASGGCTSHQILKGIATADGHAVFDGTVAVRRGAQRTTARQENRNLVLSDEAVVHTKPHLEIDADDVVCSHGATVGQLNADEVFFLRARGIDAPTARAMLTYSFAKEMLLGVSNPTLRGELTRALLDRLPEGDRLEGLE